MNKKIISIIIGFLMFSTLFVSANSVNINANNISKNNRIESYEKFLEKYGQDLYEKCPVMLEPIEPFESYNEYPKTNVNNVPSEFSWLYYNGCDWSTPARHQGNCGSCWAFASVGSLESRIKIRENLPDLSVDLSEQYVLSCLSEAGSCYGGSGLKALQYILNETEIGNNCNGIIPESCMFYQANHDVECSEKCQDWTNKLIPITEVLSLRPDGSATDINLIKTVIMESGPVATHIAATKQFSIWGLEHHDSEDYFQKPLINSHTNHLVILYGWKDDLNIGNGGYWICKNSWGNYWGYDGFFNIEYGALHIDDSMVVWAEYDPNGFDWEPIANAGEPKGGQINQELLFDASQSFDDNEITSYHWNFGDGTTSNEMIKTHYYTDNDVYTVVLTINDSNNQISKDTIQIWIQETNTEPEKPDIQGQKQGEKGKRYEYTFTSNDPDGHDIYYYIDWGNGNIMEWIGPYESGEQVSIKQRWDQCGNYTIRAKTKDVFNGVSNWTVLSISMPLNKTKQKLNLIEFLNQYSIFKLLLRTM